MLQAINDVILALVAPLFDVLLALPRDLVLIVVAVGTALIMTVIRVFTSDQTLLRRCDHDKKTLAKRIKHRTRNLDQRAITRRQEEVVALLEADGVHLTRPRRESLCSRIARLSRKARVQPLQDAKTTVALKTLRQEGLPLLVSILPIVLIATWGFARLGYRPPEADEAVGVTLYLPLSDVGSMVHLVPQVGLRSEEGWIRPVEVETDLGQTYGVARWTLSGEASEAGYPLHIRHGDETYRHELRVGQDIYAAPLKFFNDEGTIVLESKLEPYRFLGIVPGFPQVMLDAWIVAYLIIVIPFVPILKRVLRIH